MLICYELAKLSSLNSKKVSLLIVFTALTVFLNLSPIKIPAPYAPFLIYQIWEIPIVAVSILYGLLLGSSVTVLNTLVLFVVYPGALPTGPIYNMIAVLSMLIGVYTAGILTNRIRWFKGSYMIIALTLLGAVLRVIVMSLVNALCLPLPPPIGFGIPSDVAIGLLPLIGIFNASIVLYTVPLGFVLMKAIRDRVNFL